MERYGWIGTIYYYVASLIGLGLLIGGTIATAGSILTIAWPDSTEEYQYQRPQPYVGSFEEGVEPYEIKPESEDDVRSRIRRQGANDAIEGAVVAGVGAPVFLWHIRRAREREAGASSRSSSKAKSKKKKATRRKAR